MRIESPDQKEKYEERVQLTYKDLKGFKKKAQYIWEYYHTLFFAVIICIALVVGVGTSVYENIKYKDILYCAVINNTLLEEDSAALASDFGDYYGMDPESQKVTIDDTLSIVYSDDNSASETTYYSTEKLMALIAAKSIDCFITNQEVAEVYGSSATFYDLNTLLPDDLKAALGDRLITLESREDEESPTVEGAYLLDISDTEFTQKYGIRLKKTYLGVVINAQHPENAISFIRFIFGL